jgi:6-phosphogluconate dehydrogenase
MVHNGIEYGDIQLICEAYALLYKLLKLDPERMASIFAKWNTRELDSYLIEITSHILRTKDAEGELILNRILDVAGQKGTGKWTAVSALDMGIPVTLIGEAVFARCLSARKGERLLAHQKLEGPEPEAPADLDENIENIFYALYASKMISYAQGYMLMQAASTEYHWKLNYGAIALMWRGGCIIRSLFLGNIKKAFDVDPHLPNLLLDPFFAKEIAKCQPGWRAVVSLAALQGIPAPCFSTALSFYDGYRSAWLPANLLQALRDYFGAHTYERTDHKRGVFFHTDWAGTGGKVSSSSYNA